jgi:hypothetical protein
MYESPADEHNYVISGGTLLLKEERRQQMQVYGRQL